MELSSLKTKKSEIDSKNLKKVVGQKTSPKDYPCKVCNEVFSSRKDFQSHKNRVHKDNQCTLCDYSSGIFKNLVRHIQTVHEGRRDYKCEICGKAFKEAAALKYHISHVHEEREDYNPC